MWAHHYGDIVERFRRWAENDQDVRAALIVGSQARTDAPADEWSDLDVVILHTDPARLLEATDWFESFGTPILSSVEPTAFDWSRERRVLYADGRDVDFSIFPTSATPLLVGRAEGLGVLRRGFVVLVDKDRQLDRLPAAVENAGPESSGLPTPGQFRANFSDFFYHVLWVAKKLRRGEIWAAKFGCDGYLKRLLLRMIEWDALLAGSSAAEVWHEGRFLDRWATPEARSHLPGTFARYEPDDIGRALRATGRLYSVLGRKVAVACGWDYPSRAEDEVWNLVDRTLGSESVPGA
jgi:aminoglycoside 6-adenylyltransferase